MSTASDPLVALARLEGVSRATAAARAAVDVVLRRRGHRRLSSEEIADCRLAGARAAAELTGDGDRWLPGALRLCVQLDELAVTLAVAPAQALARAHSLVARGVAADADLGRLRPGAEVAERMAGLGRLLTRSSAAPCFVAAAVAHAEIAGLRPFGSGDDLLALAVERMVLINGGVDPYGVIAVEVGHLARDEERSRAMQAYATGTSAGVRAWLLHCLAAVVDAAEASPLIRPVD